MWQKSASGLAPGDFIRLRGDGWRLERLLEHGDCTQIDLWGVGQRNRGERRSLLFPFDRPVRFTRRSHPRLVSRARWMRAFRALLIRRFGHGQLRAPLTANIDLLPHQLEPVLAIVRGQATRILLADEVGLGKTIQAGLVCAEMRLRGLGDRVLILTPAGLRGQWAEELRRRFSMDAVVVDSTALARRVASLPRGLNPWTPRGVTIVSLDFAKHPEVLGPLTAIRWDVLVIDEAHGVASAPERAMAAQQLALRSRLVVMATATPHNGDHTAFRSLCSVGRLPGEGPVVLIRRSHADIGLLRRRRTSILRVRPSSAEQRMHFLLRRYVAAVWREASRRRDRGALLAMTVLWKRALSSAASLRVSAKRRLELLDVAPPDPCQGTLPLTVGDADSADLDSSDEVSSLVLAPPGLLDSGGERAALAAIVEAATKASASESKVVRLVRLLSRIDQPAIVFTEYRDTLERLKYALDGLGSVEIVHGGLGAAERHQACRRFSSGSVRVLLATDAAGEGLNLQQQCRLVVNMELPWNPMRLEQRAGRVDRLGQRQVPHVIHLVARGSAETVVLARLARRVHVARTFVGGMGDPLGGLREEDLPGELLGIGAAPRRPSRGAARFETDATRAEIVGVDLRDAAAAEATRLGDARSMLRRLSVPQMAATPASVDLLLSREIASIDARGTFATTLVCRVAQRLPTGLLHVSRIRVIDSSGMTVEEELLPIHMSDILPRSRRSRDLRRWFGRELSSSSAAVANTATNTNRMRGQNLEPAVNAVRQLMRDRERAIDRAWREGSEKGRQPGLFDQSAPPRMGSTGTALPGLSVDASPTVDSRLTFEVDMPLIASILC